jgi:isopentenyl-diphosphate delta-isomerase
VDLGEVDTSTRLFGKKLSVPLVVTAITGGYPQAKRINQNLAKACAELQIGMGVGSQRAGLEHGDDGSYKVMKDFDIPLRIGNLGAPQLIAQKGKQAFDAKAIDKARSMIEADLVAIHLNFLQEIVQPEGDTRAKGCLEAIRAAAREHPIMVTETGAGVSREMAMRLKGIGVRGIDIAGRGGTSFSAVERYRAERAGDRQAASLGATFQDWGIPAPVSTIVANVGLPIIASGGIMNGLQVAKGMVLGASAGGIARGVLKQALESPEAVLQRLRSIRDEFAAAMFLTGSKDVAELGKKPYVLTGETREWVAQLD